MAERARHAPGDGAVLALDQRRDRAPDRRLRHAALSHDGPRAALLRRAGRGAGLPEGARPDRLRLRRRRAAAAPRPAHARAPEQGRRPQLSSDRDAPLRSGAADDRRHLQRRLVGQLGLRAHDPGRGALHGQEPEADRARRVRLDRRGGRRAGGDDRDPAERQRGDRGPARPAAAVRLGEAAVAAQGARYAQRAHAAHGRAQEVPGHAPRRGAGARRDRGGAPLARRRTARKEAELSWVLEDNRPTHDIIEMVGGRPYKTYRVYEKTLA